MNNAMSVRAWRIPAIYKYPYHYYYYINGNTFTEEEPKKLEITYMYSRDIVDSEMTEL